MGSYNKPKQHLHHEFLYLNHETILNALSALEAGAVDEIILKTSEAREGGLDAGLTAGPVKAGGSKKRHASIQEELVRTRTSFSGFDAWYRILKERDAIGTFDTWDMDVRNAVAVGDTIEFKGDLQLSPVHKVLATFASFAASAGTPGSPFTATPKEIQEMKKTAKMMESWMAGRDGRRNLPVYLLPDGQAHPRIVARLDEKFIVGGLDAVEGTFTIIAQVDSILRSSQQESVIRVIRDVPPTPKEVEVIIEAMSNFIEPSSELGVEMGLDDLMFTDPTMVVRPIAVYK